jgi:hypothetical protein
VIAGLAGFAPVSGRLAVENDVVHRQLRNRADDLRVGVVQREAVAGEQPNVRSALVGEQPDAIELPLEDPLGPGEALLGERRRPSARATRAELRGLSINGLGTGINGVNIIESGKVSIEDCVIDGFKSSGIYVGMGTVFVKNSTIRNNVAAGITVKSGAKAGLVGVALVFNGVGISGTAKQIGAVYLYGNTTGDPP